MKKSQTRVRQYWLPITVSIFIIIGGAGWAAYILSAPDRAPKPVREQGHTLISPLLDCGTPAIKGMDSKKALKKRLERLIKDITDDEGTVDQVSLYFRDMNNGPWFAVNKDRRYSPGNLLHIPLMMDWFKAAENNPDLLAKELPGDPEAPSDKGNTVMDLIQGMVVDSDDAAFRSLTAASPDNAGGDVIFFDSRHEVEKTRLTVEDAAAFFRVLYNASMLSRADSTKALRLLTMTARGEGLATPIPKNIKVAHKLADSQEHDSQQKNVHDCGIVYVPRKPYLVCVMTAGKDISAQTRAIRDISETIYKWISRPLFSDQ